MSKKQCMSCEKIVEYSSGIFNCCECSGLITQLNNQKMRIIQECGYEKELQIDDSFDDEGDIFLTIRFDDNDDNESNFFLNRPQVEKLIEHLQTVLK